MERAAGRLRSNQGATIAFTAAPEVSAQPAPVSSAAPNSIQAAGTQAQSVTPIALSTAPARITRARPKRASSAGKRATSIAPHRKCKVMAAEMRETGQPRASCSAARYTPGP